MQYNHSKMYVLRSLNNGPDIIVVGHIKELINMHFLTKKINIKLFFSSWSYADHIKSVEE